MVGWSVDALQTAKGKELGLCAGYTREIIEETRRRTVEMQVERVFQSRTCLSRSYLAPHNFMVV